MAKRMKKPTTLQRFLFGYLLRTALACLAMAMLWFALLLGLISCGVVLPAYAGSDATLQAMEKLPAMSADHFDAALLPDLCRWVLLDGSVTPGTATDAGHVLATNLSQGSLSLALALGSPLGYQQFYRDVPLIDGTLCRLQYDFSMPYADPALRGRLPDFQLCMTVFLALLEVLVVFCTTRLTARQLHRETARLTEACRILADRDLSVPMPHGAALREYAQTLQTMESLRQELSEALKTQWSLEQQRTQRLAALAHDLKTPLTIIRGHAELLDEETAAPSQHPALEAILRSVDRAEGYLTDLRAACRVESAPGQASFFPAAPFVETLSEVGRALCVPRHLQFCVENHLPQGYMLYAQRQDFHRAVENLLANAARFTPEAGRITLCFAIQAQTLRITVTDTGPGFPPEILRYGGQMFHTGDTARSDGHQGLGLYFAARVAQSHGGTLQLSNLAVGGACATLALPVCIPRGT